MSDGLAQSPLAGCQASERPDVALRELPVGSLVQVASFPGGEGAIDAALCRERLPKLPVPLSSASAHDVVIMNVGPNRALILSERPDLPAALAASIPSEEGTVTDLSHARVRLVIEGPRARWVLAKGLAIDLHPDAFPVGHTVISEIAHVGVVVRRAASETYELMPYRGYARSLVEWLEEAMRHDGRP